MDERERTGIYIPFYDLKCERCGHTMIDVYEPVNTTERPPHQLEPATSWSTGTWCSGLMVRVWLTRGPNVISDECDVVVKHGICNEDGTPRRYRFKSEMRAEAKRRGLVNHVEHVPDHKGGDSSKHTSRWV